jgi:hypothetical protein
MTDELKNKLSNRIAGKHNENLKLGPEAKKRPILLVDENRLFESGRELADYLGCDKSSVYMVANGKRKTLYGHKIKYADS